MSPQRLTNLTLDGEPSDLEQDAITLEEGMKEIRYKLVELLPFIKRVRAHYASHPRGSTVVRGCKTWSQLCRGRLRITPQALIMMQTRMRLKEAAMAQAKRAKAWDELVSGHGHPVTDAEAEWLEKIVAARR
jgi:hypothetical protein